MSKCVCDMKKHPFAFPLCGKPFNPEHPIEWHKGKACGNPMHFTNIDLCGHAPECHSAAPQTEPKGESKP